MTSSTEFDDVPTIPDRRNLTTYAVGSVGAFSSNDYTSIGPTYIERFLTAEYWFRLLCRFYTAWHRFVFVLLRRHVADVRTPWSPTPTDVRERMVAAAMNEFCRWVARQPLQSLSEAQMMEFHRIYVYWRYRRPQMPVGDRDGAVMDLRALKDVLRRLEPGEDEAVNSLG